MLYDDVLTLDITSYKSYLQPYQSSTGVTRWQSNGNVTAKIGFAIRMGKTSGVLELDYTFNQKPVKYSVSIISKPSNLGVGLIYYFVCPITQKHCRKLYFGGGYFLHREAFRGCYKCQMIPTNSRQAFRAIFARCDFMQKRKHLKTHYRGKPTRPYLRYLKLERKEKQILSQL